MRSDHLVHPDSLVIHVFTALGAGTSLRESQCKIPKGKILHPRQKPRTCAGNFLGCAASAAPERTPDAPPLPLPGRSLAAILRAETRYLEPKGSLKIAAAGAAGQRCRWGCPGSLRGSGGVFSLPALCASSSRSESWALKGTQRSRVSVTLRWNQCGATASYLPAASGSAGAGGGGGGSRAAMVPLQGGGTGGIEPAAETPIPAQMQNALPGGTGAPAAPGAHASPRL